MRVKADDKNAALQNAKELFGNISPIALDEYEGESAFVTEPLKYSDAENYAKALSDKGFETLSMLRVGDL